MTRDFFNKQFAALVNAYTISQKLSDEAQDVYWEMLKDIPEKEFIDGVRHCLGACKFFPTISELGEASLPTISESAPYNPWIYTEPRQVRWQEQVTRLTYNIRKPLPDGEVKRLLKGIGE